MDLQNLRMGSHFTGEAGLCVSTRRVFSFPTHSHSYFELLFYPPFDGQVRINDTPLTATSPMAVLMTPTDLHSIQWNGREDCECIKVAFTADVAGHIARRLTGAVIVRPAEGTIPALFTELAKERSVDERILLLRALLLLLVEQGQLLPSLPTAGGGALVNRALAILGEEFRTDLTLFSLAKRLNVSYQHLCACFSAHLGLSFSAYLTDLRLRHACALLRSSDSTVSEICFACGYRNLSHFLRSFKKKYGVTPKQYREVP